MTTLSKKILVLDDEEYTKIMKDSPVEGCEIK